MRTAKHSAPNEFWAEKPDLKRSAIGTVVLFTIMAAALLVIF